MVKMKLVFNVEAGLSYSTVTLSSAGDLDGVYAGFCADLDLTIATNTLYNAELWNTYDPALQTAGLLEKPWLETE